MSHTFPDERFFQAKSWPFEEARKVLAACKNKKEIIFETGYGPSGPPHIGTFGECVRTSMIQKAFSCLSPIPTRLICFSDDMDGLRRVPENIPNRHQLESFLEYPLTKVPDPFGRHPSFGESNNQRLRDFLDNLGISYEFYSATQCYQSGLFDPYLLKVLDHHQEILKLILPTLRPERQKTYSPFLPISPSSGRVLQVAIQEYRKETIVFLDEDGKLKEIPVTGGHCKLQWKVDWGMRWVALGVDYELAGKDLIDSVHLAGGVCKILGGKAPQGMIAEHFIDEEGRKISKSKGNGLTVESWLHYAPKESLAYMMYNTPRRAKRLFFDVIPKCVDEYLQHWQTSFHQSQVEQLENPLWHIHGGNIPEKDQCPLFSFSLLLNLAIQCKGADPELLWRFITRRYPHLSPETHHFLNGLIQHAVHYYQDRVAPFQIYREPSDQERQGLSVLAEELRRIAHLWKKSPEDMPLDPANAIQEKVYELGKQFFPENLKAWFDAFYHVLLGQESGPRLGSFIALYGLEESADMIQERLRR